MTVKFREKQLVMRKNAVKDFDTRKLKAGKKYRIVEVETKYLTIDVTDESFGWGRISNDIKVGRKEGTGSYWRVFQSDLILIGNGICDRCKNECYQDDLEECGFMEELK